MRSGTSVLTPTLRYSPAVFAQAFATLGVLFPGRVFLGVGTGKAMNETPLTGGEFPGARERRDRLGEAVELIRQLWLGERISYPGRFYRTEHATVYDRPEQAIPIYLAAGGPLTARLAGQIGDGLICTSGKDPELHHCLLEALRAGAAKSGRDAGSLRRMIEIKVSYDRTEEDARAACAWWAGLALSQEEKAGVEDPVEIEDPVEMERLSDGARDRAHTRFICGADPEAMVRRIIGYVELGFTDLVFHAPHPDQRSFIERFPADLLPRLPGGPIS